MRIVLLVGAALLLGGIAAACAFWAGADQAGPIAFALGGFALMIIVPVWIAQMGNWGVPGDEPPASLRAKE